MINLLLLVVTASAQPFVIEWQNCLGAPNSEDRPYDICATADGYLITGANSATGYMDNVLLIKTDFEGNAVWQKSIGGTSGEIGFRIFSSMDGNYFINAISSSSDGDISNDPYPGTADFWFVKINGDGDIIWEKIYGGTCREDGWDGVPTSDGGIVQLGYTCSYDGDISNYIGTWDTWMLKIDNEGNKVLDFTVGTVDFDFPSGIIETSDHGFLLASQSTPTTGGNIDCIPFNENAEIVLLKLDSVANIEWQQCYGGSDDEGLKDILELEDGYLLAAYAYSNDGDVTGSGYHLGYDNYGNQTSDIWLVKIDFTGNIIWSKCYGGSKRDVPSRIFPGYGGGFVVFGMAESFDGDVVGNNSSGPGYSDIWVIKVNETGDLIWQQCFGRNGDERLESGVVDNGDGSYVIASEIRGYNSGQVTCQTNFYDSEIWFLKIRDTTVVNTTNYQIPAFDLKVYPNPAKEYVVFEIDSFKGIPQAAFHPITSLSIIITDIYGRKVATLPLIAEKTVWEISTVASGLYFYHLNNGEFLGSGKFFILK